MTDHVQSEDASRPAPDPGKTAAEAPCFGLPRHQPPSVGCTTRSAIAPPSTVSGEFLGVMTLSDRLDKEHFSFEDMDLLKTICEQAAGILLNQRLFESLSRAKEMEALQTFSAFFVHDLKNVSSTLSLTLENLPVHYENPEFREDAMRVISQKRGEDPGHEQPDVASQKEARAAAERVRRERTGGGEPRRFGRRQRPVH